jgi:hypothetical protein
MGESKSRADATQEKLFRQRKCLTLFICAAIVCLFFGAHTLLANVMAHDVPFARRASRSSGDENRPCYHIYRPR